MATTIETEPFLYSAVRNPIMVVANGSNMSSGVDEPAVLLIGFSGGDLPGDGDELTLESDVIGEIVLVFASSPDGSPDEVTAFSSGTAVDYVTALAAELSARPELNTRYIITYLDLLGVPGLKFEARVANDATYNLAATAGGFTPATITPADVTPFTQPPSSMMRFSVSVWMMTSGLMPTEDDVPQFELEYEDEAPADREGNARFPFDDVLRNRLSPTIPPPGTDATMTAINSYCAYVVAAAERFGTPPRIHPSVRTSILFAYLTGRDEVARVNYPDWNDQLLLSGGRCRFLSTWPNTAISRPKIVLPGQEEYLTWLWQPTSVDVVLKVDLYYETGDNVTGHVLETFPDRTHELLITPVGFNARELASVDPTRRVRAYRIYLTDLSRLYYSELRYYEVDWRVHKQARQLLYHTSSGSIDTIVLHGRRTTKSVAVMERSERVTDMATTIHDARDTVAMLTSIGDEHEVGTTYLTRAELPVLADLIGSESVHELVGSEWIPVQLLDKDEVDGASDDPNLVARVISYRYAVRNRARSVPSQ